MSLTPNKQQILWIQHLKEMNDDLDWLHAHFSYNDRELWYQYREDDYLLNRPSWDFWYDYQNDLHRIREEKINQIFGLGKETLKEICPKKTFYYLCIMNSEQYLNYLQESQHIALESYNYIGEMYNSYMTSQLFEEFIQLQRDEKIEEILN